jgi:hypothetical protein
MIEEALKFAGADSVKKAVDVGCGIGGSARYIVSRRCLLTMGGGGRFVVWHKGLNNRVLFDRRESMGHQSRASR